MRFRRRSGSRHGAALSCSKAWAATVAVAVLFVVSTLRPDLLTAQHGEAVAVKEAQREEPGPAAVTSFSSAVRKAMPAVVNIYTSQAVKRARQPLMDDPVFRYFFGEQGDPEVQRREGLGSGVIVSDNGYILTNHHVVESVDQIEVALGVVLGRCLAEGGIRRYATFLGTLLCLFDRLGVKVESDEC